ncbi:phosphatidylserine decarboxylase proenzyme, putative [Eimeria mitis]|uniref:Phosphatidylserine decarboxylase proenzyme, putative n=1 Tax=Eimeria mitis TaxID=44415 RepID=U6K3B1_9EIME|nr:phosphatidylserine decarboxylase proenzyme, putative [Eimeria mitis]CDJ31451.1 phosphatidylserine decarboxylase proenzyme, putative [Eimeria mitis]
MMMRRLLSPSLRWRGSRSIALAAATTGCLSFVAIKKFREAIAVTGNAADVQSPNKLFCLRLVFGRARSRLLGRLMAWRIPVSLRPLLMSIFLHLQPAAAADSRYPLVAYESFGELFCRTLRDRAREIMDLSPLAMVSPCDCTVSVLGEVDGDRIPQVKGATYSLKAFLGINPKTQENNKDIFSVQERVILSGSWEGGAMHIAAVAACNVGDIRLEKEPDLRTNQDRVVLRHLGGDVDIRTYRGSRRQDKSRQQAGGGGAPSGS